MKRRKVNWFFSTLLILVQYISEVQSLLAQEKPRVIVLTDIMNEPDDEQSLIRYLVHSNLFETEALIATTSYFMKNQTHPQRIIELVNKYGEVRSNLVVHAEGYPTAQYLLNRIKWGNDGYGMADVYDGNDSPGSDLIISIVDENDPRPVWLLLWGGGNTLAQAILKVRNNRPITEQNAFIDKLRVYEISGQDEAGAWICHNYPDIFWLRSLNSFQGMSPRKNRFGAPGNAGNTEIISDAWVNANIRTNHGVLGSEYPLKKYKYEGDSPSFLYIMSHLFGLNELEQQYQGSWGARFKPDKEKNPGSGSRSEITNNEINDYYMYTDAADTWNYQDTTYTNSVYAALFRWREAFQKEFQTRMDWCVQSSYGNANHAPEANVGSDLKHIVQSGDLVSLSATCSSDPDGDNLSYITGINIKNQEVIPAL